MSEARPQKLTVTLDQMNLASESAGISPDQKNRIWDALAAMTAPTEGSRSGAPAVAWYFGSAVIFVAMTLLIGKFAAEQGWSATLLLSLVYTGVFFGAGRYVGKQPNLHVLERLLYALTTVMTPITVFCIEMLVQQHYDPELGGLLMMGAGTVVGLGVAAYTRTSLAMVPTLLMGCATAFIATDMATNHDFNQNLVVVLYGLLVCLLGLFTNPESDEDFGFWYYLVGALLLWGGLTQMVEGANETGYALYALAGVASMVVSVLVSRRVFAITGGLAIVVVYFGHLVWKLAANNITTLAIALTLLGLATIWLGVWYARNARRIEQAVLSLLPTTLKNRLPH